MFYAIRDDGVRVSADHADKEMAYRCPLCNGAVVARQGSVRVWHFAHVDKTDCDADFKTPDMSEWHRIRQSLFPEHCQEVTMSDKKNGEKHRADVLIFNQYVIEFQQSKISSEEFDRRNRFYTRCGYKVVWVFDLSEAADHLSIWQYTNTIRFRWSWAWRTWCHCDLNAGNVLLLIETRQHTREQLLASPCWSRVIKGKLDSKSKQSFSEFWVQKHELIDYTCFSTRKELDHLTSHCPQCGRLVHKYKLKAEPGYYYKCFHDN